MYIEKEAMYDISDFQLFNSTKISAKHQNVVKLILYQFFSIFWIHKDNK